MRMPPMSCMLAVYRIVLSSRWVLKSGSFPEIIGAITALLWLQLVEAMSRIYCL